MYGNLVFNPSMGGVGYRGPSGIPGTPVMKTANVRPGVKFHTPRSAGAQMLPGKMRQAQASAVAASRKARAGVAASDAAYKKAFDAKRASAVTKAASTATDTGKKGILGAMSRMSRGTKVGIGLGLGVAAGVAMNRRGEGASSGRQSIYRY